jgi:hypothetical protein
MPGASPGTWSDFSSSTSKAISTAFIPRCCANPN